MTELTSLDTAFAAMEASDAVADRMAFYARLAETELFLLLESEAVGDTIEPKTFDLPQATFVVAFDRLDRLVSFAEKPVPYVAVSGKTIARMIVGNGFGLGLNLEVAPSSTLLPPEAIAWLCETLENAPDEIEATPKEVGPPPQVPETLLTALDGKLALASGLATGAYFCSVTYDNDSQGALLAFLNAAPGAETALSQAVTDALTFSGIEAGMLDVMFIQASDDLAAKIARVGLRFDIPQPEPVDIKEIAPPGSDPNKPPKLR